jgi:hypothetical protein
MSSLSDNDEAVERARAILSENFPNWVMVVVTEDDELYVDWSSLHIAEGLMHKGLKQFKDDDCWEHAEVEWDDDDDDDDEGEEWQEA